MLPTPEGDQPRRWLTLIAMTGSLSMIFVDITVVGVALPLIQADLGMSDAALQWVASIYLLVMACLVALSGRVADGIGRVPAFVTGVVLFALASVACGMATSATALIVGRAVQGAAAALMQPASSALVIGAFAPGSRGKAMAVYVGIPLLFMVLGPLLGGSIAQAASWRWCFWVNVPVAVASLVMTFIARPVDRRAPSRRVDVVAAALLLLGLPMLVLGVQQGNAWGWVEPWFPAAAASVAPVRAVTAVPLLVVGTALLALFVRSQWRSTEPLIAIGLFRDRGLLANALTLFLMQFAMSGLLIQGSIYAQEVLGYGPRRAGASLLPLLVPIVVVVHIAGRLYDRVGVRVPALVGSSLAALGGLIAGAGAWSADALVIGAGFAVMGTGIGFVMSPTNTDSLSRVPAAARAQVSGLMQTMRHVGGTTGLAMIGAVVLVMRTGSDAAPKEAFATAIAAGYGLAALACAAAAIAVATMHRPGRAEGHA